jgi:tRNA(fMet)-specific endonuclease VapC
LTAISGVEAATRHDAYAALKTWGPCVTALLRSSEELLLPMVVVDELRFGFRNGDRYDRNLEELDEFLAHPAVLLRDVTRVTADRFGRIAALLRKAGTPVPTNDIWMAAHALETGAELVTFDRHFERIAGLAVTIER